MEEKDFRAWLTNFMDEEQINLNDVLTFKSKEGTRKISVAQIFDYIDFQDDEDKKAKFKDSLEKGKEANNIMGFMYHASKRFPIKEREDVKEQAEKQTDNWFKKQEDLKTLTSKSFAELEKQLKDPKTAESALKKYNEFISQFKDLYNYSLNNNLLIKGQLENRGINYSGIVKSEKDWNEEQVRTRGRPLFIYVPKKETVWEMEKVVDENGIEKEIPKLDENGKKIPEKDENGKIKEELRFSLSGRVWDISQTDAYEQGIYNKFDSKENIASKLEITPNFLDLVSREIEHSLNVEITFRPLDGNEVGYYTYQEGKHQIHIDNSNDRALESQLATLLHETGHAILHRRDMRGSNKNSDKSTEKKEAEAESFAYVVGQQFGLELNSGEYILGYLQKSDVKLKDVFDDVYKAVKEINTKIEIDKMVNAGVIYQEEAKQAKDMLSSYKEIDNSEIEDIKAQMAQREETKEETKETSKNTNRNRQR